MKIERLISVLGVQSESYNQFRMFAYIIRFCKGNNIDFYINEGNIYITKGLNDSYPCIVAHMDTVHDIVKDLTVININGNLTGFNAHAMEQTGIGGDDKVGIFIALECLLKFDCIKAVFFRDEEVGCEGSYNADIDFFNDCNFVLQCDRKGNKDFITNASGAELSGKDFQADVKHILKRYKYRFETGLMTDVMALKEIGIKCSMANLGCGYYNPHCSNEYVSIRDVSNCMKLVFDIIEIMGSNNYYHEVEVIKKEYNYHYEDDWYNKNYSAGFNSKKYKDEDLYEECTSCGNITMDTTYSREWHCNLCDECTQSLMRQENEDYKSKIIKIPF